MTKLLVASGTTVEVINLDESDPELICDNLPDLPYSSYAAIGQLFRRNTPIICHLYQCRQFQNGAWNQVSNLTESKNYIQSVAISNPLTEEDDDLIVVTGGWNGSALSTVESFDGKTWNKENFNYLPEKTHRHCNVKINNTLIMSIDGSPTGSPSAATVKTYFFNVIENQWFQGPKLLNSRVDHSCGILNWKNPST